MSSTTHTSTPRGVHYEAANDDFRAARLRCSIACQKFNELPEAASAKEKEAAWRSVIGAQIWVCRSDTDDRFPNTTTVFRTFTIDDHMHWSDAPGVKGPIWMDYGLRVKVHPTAFINRDCKILDSPTADITIGPKVKIATNVTIIGVGHPLDPDERNGNDPSIGFPVTIEEGAWICAGAIIGPGVTIGKGATVAMGGVVRKDVAPYTAVAGNPATMFCEDVRRENYPVQPDEYVKTMAAALELP